MVKRDHERFDTSDYPIPNPYGIERLNKKELGKMKDECNGRVVREVLGLRSKVYMVLFEDEEIFAKKLKGVNSQVVATMIEPEDYRRCLFENELLYRDQYNIRARFHNIATEKTTKLALSPYDDKRYLLPDTTDTLPWGHYKITQEDLTKYLNDKKINH